MASQITGYIGQINPGNGINYSIGSTVYGECNTAATTAAKTVDMTGFILIKGATIYVKFTNANTASSPTLNVQGTGAKPIIQNNFTTMYWPANTLIGLTYDGTNWVTNDLIDYNNFLQIKPKGGYYNNNKTSDNSIDVGAIKITLPVPANSNNNAMLNFQVVIYHYNSKDYVTYYISGYPFENTWHPDRCNAYSISNVINSRTNATIRYGNDGTNLCITIGEENTSWKWSQIYITNVYVGYTNITQEKYKNYMDGDWNISFSSTDPVLSTIDYTIENPNILTSITNAINNLDVSNISGFGKGRTLSALSETNGKISATFQDIEITTSQVSDFPSSMPASDVSAWAKAANKPSYSLSEITSASDIQAIEVLTGTSGFLKKTAANKWELDTTTYVTSSGVMSITLKAGTGISLDTDNTAITTSGTRTISLATITQTNTTSSGSVAHGGSFNVIDSITYDTYGRVTKTNTKTITLPSDNNTDEKVKQTSSSTTANYKLLFTTSASPTSGAAAETYYNTNLQYNPGTNILSTGNLSLSGNLSVTGATTLSDSVTVGGQLTTNSLIVNGNSQFNNSVNFNSLPTIGNQPLLQALGLSNALHFIGITSTTMVDGRTTATVMIGSTTYTPQIGDVVLYGHREYVWTSTATNGWEMLGFDASTEYDTGNASTNTWISRIKQKTDGTIEATTSTLDTSGTWSGVAAKTIAANITSVSNNIAYYSNTSGTFASTTDFYINENKLGINTNTQPVGMFLVKGLSDFIANSDSSYNIMRFKNNNDATIGYLTQNVIGTTSTAGRITLQLGNNIAIGEENNSMGRIVLYSSSTGSHAIRPASEVTKVDGYTNNRSAFIPNTTGWIAMGGSYTTTTSENGSTVIDITGVGNLDQPIYLDEYGILRVANTYAGGTNITLNGEPKSGSTATIYAPTSPGTANTQALVSNGTSNTPKWVNIAPVVSITDGDNSNAPKIKITVLGQTTSTAVELTKASTNTYGVTKLSSATDSTATDIAATPAAVKAAYDAATTAATNSAYAGNIETTSAATYNTEPEVKSIKITGNTTANTATNGVVLQYDATLKVLNFVFA